MTGTRRAAAALALLLVACHDPSGPSPARPPAQPDTTTGSTPIQWPVASALPELTIQTALGERVTS